MTRSHLRIIKRQLKVMRLGQVYEYIQFYSPYRCDQSQIMK